jgi:hypothetical protein
MDDQEGLRTKLKINDSIAALMAVIGMLCAQLETERLFEDTLLKPRYIQDRTCKVLRGVQTATTLVLLVMIVRHSLFYFEFMKQKRKILKESK